MFGIITRKRDGQIISDTAVRYETAVKNKRVFSLAFEATYHLKQLQSPGFVAAVGAACTKIAKEFLLMRQIQLLPNAILAPQKPGFTWLPIITEHTNEHNVLLTTDKVIPAANVEDFRKLLSVIVAKEGVYEIAPGLALFGDNGLLRVTASRSFIATLNNE